MYGSLIFLCSDKDAEHIQYIIESDANFVENHVSEIIGPFKYHLEESGFLYRVLFHEDQWLNVVEMGETLDEAGIDSDIVHAVCDDTFIDVVSTSGYYDQFVDTSSEIAELTETFGFNVDDDVELSEFED